MDLAYKEWQCFGLPLKHYAPLSAYIERYPQFAPSSSADGLAVYHCDELCRKSNMWIPFLHSSSTMIYSKSICRAEWCKLRQTQSCKGQRQLQKPSIMPTFEWRPTETQHMSLPWATTKLMPLKKCHKQVPQLDMFTAFWLDISHRKGRSFIKIRCWLLFCSLQCSQVLARPLSL